MDGRLRSVRRARRAYREHPDPRAAIERCPMPTPSVPNAAVASPGWRVPFVNRRGARSGIEAAAQPGA